MSSPSNNDLPLKNKSKISRETSRKLAFVLVLTIILLVIYFGSMELDIGIYVMWLYMIVFAALLISYLAYNRAFVNKDVTPEMLPSDWDDIKKADFIRKNHERAEKSKWMLMVIIPFATVFLAEACYLFLWDYIVNIFN